MKILRISFKNLKRVIKIISQATKEGKVLVCPTDTVYGLLCNATNKKAVKKLFEIKKRPEEKAIPIFVKNLKMAKKLAFLNKNQEKILRKVWPGKVTVILKRKQKLPKILFGKKSTIGLRIPNYKLVNILLKKLNLPLTGTSANISGKPPSGNIKKVLEQFKNRKYQPDLVIDVGNLPKNKPSTVLDLTTWPPKILRT